MLLETLSSPLACTEIDPALRSPLAQFITALGATTNAPRIVKFGAFNRALGKTVRLPFKVPLANFSAPDRALLPDQLPRANDPLGVSTVPVVLNAQLMAVMPLAAVF